jgi:hypothetical protein
LVDGLVLTQNVIKSSGGPARMEKARIGLIQFQLSPPKPDVSLLLNVIQRYNFSDASSWKRPDGKPDSSK